MIQVSALERILCVVDRCLRVEFPDSYFKRCLYASYGIHALLTNLGLHPLVAGGHFSALVVAKDGSQASIQGYGSNKSEHSHYWVELDGAIIDLGTIYLPVESRFAAHPMPALFWAKASELPKSLSYDTHARYSDLASLALPMDVAERVERFMAQCTSRVAKSLVKPKLGTWLLRSPASILNAAERGDQWARGALRFEALT